MLNYWPLCKVIRKNRKPVKLDNKNIIKMVFLNSCKKIFMMNYFIEKHLMRVC